MKLTNDTAEIIIDPESGGRIASLRVSGIELLAPAKENPLLWGCYPMAPWVGRTKHGQFDFEGQVYALPLTLPPHAIHGTTWNRAWRQETSHSLSTEFGSEWPFAGRVTQHFVLSENSLLMEMEARTLERPFPASLGWHPCFRRILSNNESASVSLVADKVYERDDEMIPTGNLLTPRTGPWDDCFTAVTEPPIIRWGNFLSLQFQSNASHWVLYDMEEEIVCLEPMTAPPNSLNTNADLVTLDQPLHLNCELKWQLLDRGAN